MIRKLTEIDGRPLSGTDANAGITLEDYLAVYDAADYKTVCEIMEGEGKVVETWTGDPDQMGNRAKTTVVRYEGRSGGHATFNFLSDGRFLSEQRLMHKSQDGLESLLTGKREGHTTTFIAPEAKSASYEDDGVMPKPAEANR